MAKKSMIVKQQKPQKFKTREYNMEFAVYALEN